MKLMGTEGEIEILVDISTTPISGLKELGIWGDFTPINGVSMIGTWRIIQVDVRD